MSGNCFLKNVCLVGLAGVGFPGGLARRGGTMQVRIVQAVSHILTWLIFVL
jgi:hypothetical protein